MKPGVRFILVVATVALVGFIAINVLLGPPGLSKEYLADHKARHDHYLEVRKSEAFKRYEQRPGLNGPGGEGASAHLAENIAFAEAYRQMPEFVAEQKRIALYEQAFSFFNASLVVIIALYFGRKPLLRFLDAGIEELRRKLREAEDQRLAAEKRRQDAEARLAGLPEESRRIAAETQERLDRELAELAEANQRSLAVMEADLKDRRREVVKEAEFRVKQELVNAAINSIEERYRTALAQGGETVTAHQAELLDAFVGDLEARA